MVKKKKKLMIYKSFIAEVSQNEQSQIYRTLLQVWVPNEFLQRLDKMDFQLQYGGTFL